MMKKPTGFDYIVVIGGLIDEIPNLRPALLRFLQDAAAARVPLVGVCTGAFILHRAGLMDGYRCCVSWFHHADFLEQFDGLTPVSDQIFIIDRDRLTCSGGASSAHLAAHLVEKHVGIAPARKSLQIMIIDEALRAEEPQPGIPLGLSTTDDVVRKGLLQMRQNVETPLTISEVARRVGVSRRGLERRIREDPGQVTERLLPVDAAGPGRAAAEPDRPDGRRHRDVDRILRHLALRARLQAAPRADAGKGAPRARR